MNTKHMKLLIASDIASINIRIGMDKKTAIKKAQKWVQRIPKAKIIAIYYSLFK